MGGKKGSGGINEKQLAGRVRKEEAQAKKAAQEAAKQEATEASEWKKGANIRKAARDEAASAKADEAARKRQEKAALLAAEEEALGSGGKAKSGAGGASQKKKKNQKKDDLALLEESLVKAADRNVRKKKEEIIQKKQQQEARAKASEEEKSNKPIDPLLANTEQMIGAAVSPDDGVGRQANVARMQDQGASGIDAALDSLNIASPGVKKSAKALYNDFEARMLSQVKEEYPGLRLTQYKEKVWALWKKSPENPANQQDLVMDVP